MNQKFQHFIILTGLSGAGKSQALKCFEDFGFFCIDNLPVKLLEKFCELYKQSEEQLKKIVIVLDLRDQDFLNLIEDQLSKIKNLKINYKLVFLEANEKEIIKRYNETRRLHPLAKDISIEEGIKKEIELLGKIREKAEIIIDTTGLNLQELKNTLSLIFVQGEDKIGLNISITSFGYKYGILQNIDLLFDVRFLINPFYKEELSNKTGFDSEVKNYILEEENTKIFLNKFFDFINYLIKQYKKEGKSYLSIGIGCTGGKHRSVVIASELKNFLEKNFDVINIHLFHRDIYK
ncbi:MAG TPA: RNase adapter RapZ [bacterium]|nr:RNase adapter RapZ [bacterium]